MKIKEHSSFSPVTIKLETPEEVTMFENMLHHFIHIHPSDGLREPKEMASKMQNWFASRGRNDRWTEDNGEYVFTRAITAWDAWQAATLAAEARIRDLEADAKRLDWLDSMNLKLNAHYGTTYKWKLILSPNVIRIASGKAGNGYVADIDLQDSFPKGFDSVRKAIDRAREQSKENQG